MTRENEDQMPIRAKECVDGWIRCRNCDHKLAKYVIRGKRKGTTDIEFKCHSCKTINLYTP